MLSILYTVVVGLTVVASSKTEEQDCTPTIDMCIVADASKSVCTSDPTYNPATDSTCGNWKQMIDFMYNTASKLDIGPSASRVAVVVFATKAVLRFRLSKYTDKPSLLSAISNLQFTGGNTNTSGALDVARDQVFGADARANATKLLLVITDGKASNHTAVAIAIAKTHADHILTIAVGISSEIDPKALRQLASDPKEEGKTYFPVPDFNILSGILPSISTVICRDLPAIAENSSQVCAKRIDLVIVLDTSESICGPDPTYKKTGEGCDNWKAMLDFAHGTTDRLAISPDHTNVGLITFATKAYLVFNFTRYQDGVSLGLAIDNIKYTAGSTNTAAALDAVHYKAFSRARKDSTKVVILLTDGKSSDPDSVQAAIDRVQAANVTTIAVGVTAQVKEDTLKQLSSKPKLKNQNYFLAANFDAMNSILRTVLEQICSAAPATTTPLPSTTATPEAPHDDPFI